MPAARRRRSPVSNAGWRWTLFAQSCGCISRGRRYFQLRRYEEAVSVLKRRIFRFPETDISRVLLAATYGQLGRLDEARAEWREVLRVNPDYSLEHRRKVLPYKNPHDFEAVVDGLRKAGVVG